MTDLEIRVGGFSGLIVTSRMLEAIRQQAACDYAMEEAHREAIVKLDLAIQRAKRPWWWLW